MKLPIPISPGLKPTRTESSVAGRRDDFMVRMDEATLLLHCHRVTLLRLIQRGQLHLFKTGKTWSFYGAEISALRNRNIAVYPHLTIARKPAHPVL
jgi:hypothetical protein